MELIRNLNIIILVASTIGTLLGTGLTALFKSFLTEKGKNLATRQDIENITSKIEGIKESYSKSLENFKNELKKDYELAKPSLELTIKLDNELIDKIITLNTPLFEFSQLNRYENAAFIYTGLAHLSQFIAKYKVRYKNLKEVDEIIAVQNRLAEMKQEESIDLNELGIVFDKLSFNLDSLLNYFLPQIEKKTF